MRDLNLTREQYKFLMRTFRLERYAKRVGGFSHIRPRFAPGIWKLMKAQERSDLAASIALKTSATGPGMNLGSGLNIAPAMENDAEFSPELKRTVKPSISKMCASEKEKSANCSPDATANRRDKLALALAHRSNSCTASPADSAPFCIMLLVLGSHSVTLGVFQDRLTVLSSQHRI